MGIDSIYWLKILLIPGIKPTPQYHALSHKFGTTMRNFYHEFKKEINRKINVNEVIGLAQQFTVNQA